MDKPKKNFMRKTKRNKRQEFETNFHVSINSKALFGLSDGALKLYLFLILNGKKSMPSAKMFGARTKKSERTISRLYQELKDKGFLKIICVKPKVYKYLFDFEGNLKYNKKVKNIDKLINNELEEDTFKGSIENENIKVTEELEKTANEIESHEVDPLIEKAKVIKEYENFAILENMFWHSEDKVKSEIIQIIKDRKSSEPELNFVLEWFLQKVENV